MLILFQKPVEGRITSKYGWRIHPVKGAERFHSGIDYAAAVGTPVGAAAAGTVTHAGALGDAGLTVKIAHSPTIETTYAHNSRMLVKVGQEVAKGQIVAHAGATGLVTGPHVHFALKVSGNYVDPAEALTLGLNTETGQLNSLPLKRGAVTLSILAGILLLYGLIK